MRRGELYLVRKGPHDTRKEDPRRQRIFIVASRQALIDSRHSTVICAPVYSAHSGLNTQVSVGISEGLKKDSCIHCDELVNVHKVLLTHYLGRLDYEKTREFDRALAVALGLS